MHSRRNIIAASIILSLSAFAPAAFAKDVASATSFDGTWSGKWGGRSASKLRIKDNKVISYTFKGRSQRVGSTKVSGGKLVFGSGYKITVTLTGPNSANAFYKGDGTATAELTR